MIYITIDLGNVKSFMKKHLKTCCNIKETLPFDGGRDTHKVPFHLMGGRARMGVRSLIDIAKTLRKNSTDTERYLWEHLRNRQVEGFTFNPSP